MNGSTGIQPTVELATTNGNGYFPYPVMYGNGGGFGGNGGFFGGDGIWAIILLALLFGWGNNGNGNGFFGNNGFDNGYAWLSNGQKEIMQNTNSGFDTLHLSNQLEGVNNGIHDLSNAICSSTASVNSNISNGFYNAEIAANNRQVADMNQNFNNQIATLQGFNNLQSSFQNCCCENRLGIANLTSTVLSENCADRALLQESLRDVLENNNANTQRILDRICQDKIDEKNDTISQLRQEILYARGQASQIAQTGEITRNVYNELKNCPVGTVPVFGNQPIFTCPNNNGCGCGNTGFYSNLI